MRIVRSNASGIAPSAAAGARAVALAAGCVTALALATPARASEDDVARWLAESEAAAAARVVPSATPDGSAAAQRSGPQSPDAHATLREQLEHANAAYRARRWARALEAYQAIIAAEPGHAFAWLRIGNLHQRRRQLLQAASAYRKAARDDGVLTAAPDASATALDEIRAKALVNLALVNLELADAALAQIDRLPAHLAGERDAVAAAVQRARDAVVPVDAESRVGPRPDPVSSPAAPPRVAPLPAPPGGLPAPRAGSRATVSPAPPEASAGRDARPTVEYLQGAPKP